MLFVEEYLYGFSDIKKFNKRSEKSYDQVEEIFRVNPLVWFDLILLQEQLNSDSFFI